MRARLFWSRIALVALVVTPIAPARPDDSSVPASVGPWLPLDAGHEWSYAYESERWEQVTGGPEERDRFRGTLRDVVKGPATGFGDAAVEVVSELRGRRQGSAVESTEIRRAVLERVGTGYRVHALETESPMGDVELTRYDPPLRQLATGPGAPTRWVIGTVELGGLRTRLDAEIVGIQDAETPSGNYRDCLVVRYRGELRGTIELFGTQLEVTGGHVTATEWFARGVGLVLAKEEVEQDLLLTDGTTLSVREQTRYELSSHGVASATPTETPTPTPAAPTDDTAVPAAR